MCIRDSLDAGAVRQRDRGISELLVDFVRHIFNRIILTVTIECNGKLFVAVLKRKLLTRQIADINLAC